MQGEQSRQQLSSVPGVAVRGNTGKSGAFLSQPAAKAEMVTQPGLAVLPELTEFAV